MKRNPWQRMISRHIKLEKLKENMNKSKLFEYAVIYNPTEQEVKDGKKAEIVVKPTLVLVESVEAAKMKAVRDIPTTWDDKLAQLEVAVRPF